MSCEFRHGVRCELRHGVSCELRHSVSSELRHGVTEEAYVGCCSSIKAVGVIHMGFSLNICTVLPLAT